MREISYADNPQFWAIWDNIGRNWASKPYSDRRRARGRADRLDLQYGAIRYSVRPVALL